MRGRTCWRTTARVVVLLAGVLLVGPASGTLGSAMAHTGLRDSQPANGARLDRAPTTVLLEFDEEVRPDLATVTVRVGTGRPDPLEVRQGPDATTVVADVPITSTGEGRQAWSVAYRVTSTDGHPVQGVLRFQAPAGRETTPAAGRDDRSAPGRSSTPAGTPADSSPGTTRDDSGEDGNGVVSTLVIGVVALLGASIGCALLVRGRRRHTEA